MTQGAINVDTIFEFYGITDVGAPLFRYDTDVAGNATIFRPQLGNVTSVANPSLLRSAVYPNPSPVGGALSFEFSENLPSLATFELRSLDGRSVHREVLSDVASTSISISTPAVSKPGVYIYTFLSPGGRLLGSGKILLE